MEDGMDLPARGDAEAEGHAGDHFFNFERTHSFHLQFLGTIHVKVSCFKPDLVSYFPRGEFRGNPFLHSLLGNLVSALDVVMSSGKISELGF